MDGTTRHYYIRARPAVTDHMPLQLGTGVHGLSREDDNVPSLHLFAFDVTLRVDFNYGGAMVACMKLEGDLIWFRAREKTFMCNLWNVTVRVKEKHPHAFFLYETNNANALSEDDVMIILFSCNDVRNEALSVLRRTGALLLDEMDQHLFGKRPGTARIDTHNILGDCMRRNSSLPDMHVIWEEMDEQMDDEM